MNLIRKLWHKLTKPAGLVAWLGDGAKPVELSEAIRRSRICENCPANLRGSMLGETVGEAVQKLVILKNRMRLRVQNEHRLHTCSACGCKLSVKIWVDYKIIKQYQRSQETEALRAANPDCWQI